MDGIHAGDIEKEETKRIEYIDLFRGFGIMIMILDHIYISNIFSYFIHAFHMPMFFFISGYFYKSSGISISQYIDIKVKSLLIPYFAVGFFHYLFWLIQHDLKFSIKPLAALLWINTNDTLPIANAIWFLTALFIAEVVYFIIDCKIHNGRFKFLVICIVAFFGMAGHLIITVMLPWGISQGFVAVGFIHFGREIRQSKLKLFNTAVNLQLMHCIIIGIIAVVLIFINDYVNMRMEMYGFYPLFWVNAFTAILVGFNGCRELDLIARRFRLIDSVFSKIKYIGRYSITFLCFNQLIILYGKKITSLIAAPKGLQNVLIFAIVIVLLYLLNNIKLVIKFKGK